MPDASVGLAARRREVRLFLVATFAWTWGFWIALYALTALGVTASGQALFVTLHVAGGLGPTVFAVVCVARRPGRGVLGRFMKSWLPGRVPSLGLAVLAAVATVLASRPLAFLLIEGEANPFVANWPAMLAAFPVMIVGGGLEEPGWRGVVYDDSDSLKDGRPWAFAAMALVWVLWHAPLWFIPGTYQNLHLDFTSFALSTTTLTLLLYAIRLSGAAVGWCIVIHALFNTMLGAFTPFSGVLADRMVSAVQMLAVGGLFVGFLRLRSVHAGGRRDKVPAPETPQREDLHA